MRRAFGYLVKAAVAIAVDFLLSRFLGPYVSTLSVLVGFGLCELWGLVRHAISEFLADNWKQIAAGLLVISMITAPVWMGIRLLLYGHPFLGWPLILVGQPAMLALVIKEKRKDIIEWSFGILFFAAPLWIGGLLLWYGHPLLAAALMFIGEPLMVAWLANLPDPDRGSRPPSDGSGSAEPPLNGGSLPKSGSSQKRTPPPAKKGANSPPPPPSHRRPAWSAG
jgi:hypothetical protein